MRKFLSIMIAISGISFIVIIHELGHLLAAKFFGVGAPSFSIGFGPEITGIQLGQTFYKISLLPLGGYVLLNPVQLDAAPFITQAIIILAGIAVNFLFTYGVLAWLSYRGLPYYDMLQTVVQGCGIRSSFVGPIGIISLISYSATLGINYLLMILATISFSIGMFNLLPIPFLDGGQLVGFAYAALERSFPGNDYGNMLIIILLIVLVLYVVKRQVLRGAR